MNQGPQVVIMFEQSEIEAWSVEFALDDQFIVNLPTRDLQEPNPAKEHPLYNVDYGQLAAITVQTIGAVSGLIPIFDKAWEIYRKRTAASKAPTIEPILVIGGTKYRLTELTHERLHELGQLSLGLDGEKGSG